MEALGRHMLVEFTGCDEGRLADLDLITEAMLRAARAAGATVLTHRFHRFAGPEGGQGVSGAVIISESHLAIHTWPEHAYAAVDLFTCGEHVDPMRAHAVLREALGAQADDTRIVSRGPSLRLPGS
ncbi:MAG TPA: adenosylmethionine decarboxylase [Holophagaceae bacterium]|nr:adenosylmethionine decarboxylase [Holophagaceae bacterium]